MRTYDRFTTCSLSVWLTAVAALPSLAQETSTGKPAEEKPAGSQMWETMLELAKPGENHKLLESLAGSWTYTSSLWGNTDTNTPPMESSGTTAAKSTLGGRYIQTDHTGNLMGMEFHGREISGYDNAKKKFVSSWVDNMGTGIMMFEGIYDPATKTITYTSEYEPVPGLKTKVRQQLKLTDEDHHTLVLYEGRGDGKEWKTMEISFTRAPKSQPVPTGQ